MIQRTLEFDDAGLAAELFGPQNANLSLLAGRFGVRVETRGARLTILAKEEGAVDLAASALAQLYAFLKSGRHIFAQDVDCACRFLACDPGASLAEVFDGAVWATSPKRMVSAKTPSQRDYLAAIRGHDLVFAVGPAGTGKTYLAVAMAVVALIKRTVKRIVLTRPAVEAGERLGFLPGDLVEKVNPYLRPLYDALHEMLDSHKVQEMLASGTIEVAPLAFMRGRTLNDSFIILDEAQNTTPEQMKMFLTRLGVGSKAVVTGDVTQIDLPGGRNSGLIQAARILDGVAGIRICRFSDADVIRHPLVGRIVQAYDRAGAEGQRGGEQ